MGQSMGGVAHPMNGMSAVATSSAASISNPSTSCMKYQVPMQDRETAFDTMSSSTFSSFGRQKQAQTLPPPQSQQRSSSSAKLISMAESASAASHYANLTRLDNAGGTRGAGSMAVGMGGTSYLQPQPALFGSAAARTLLQQALIRANSAHTNPLYLPSNAVQVQHADFDYRASAPACSEGKQLAQ